MEGSDLHLALDAGGDLARPLYAGNLDWKEAYLHGQTILPLPISAVVKFTVWRDGFTIEQGQFAIALSRLDLQAEISDFHSPQWKYRYLLGESGGFSQDLAISADADGQSGLAW